MGLPHVIAIPAPIQGNVIPMLELVQRIAICGFKVSFVNTELNHERIMNALPDKDNVRNIINFVAIADGLEPWMDRNDWKKCKEPMEVVMVKKMNEFIENINRSDDDDVTCLIVDETISWALQIAEGMQIKRVSFWPCASVTQALMFNIEKMIDDGFINNRGTPMGDQMIQLSPSMPKIRTADLPWLCYKDYSIREIIFQIQRELHKSAQAADWLLCNAFYEMDPAAFSLFPNMTPIGPLLATNRLRKSTGYFLQEDSTCLKWLDQQLSNSVIYVAFGSSTVFSDTQFKELALALELTGKPFLWVLRPDLINNMDESYVKGFKERVGTRGRIASWAPQQAVLSHPSVACFVSHCGWNSTLEGTSNGVPILCWPYYGDQILNKIYICDVWKVGLGLDRDEKGIISHEEIKNKVLNLLIDKSLKANALRLKEFAISSVGKGGLSRKNFNNFIKWMKN